MMLTQSQVKELFDYRDGKLLRRVTTGGRGLENAEAGSDDGQGYRRVSVSGGHYRIHRVIWLWVFGYMPEHDIDHINRDRRDNRIENLREVSRTCNLRNSGTPRHNTSGVKGVSWCSRLGKWRVDIVAAEKQYNFGFYISLSEAVCHRLAAEQALNWSGCDSSSPAFKYVEKMCGRGGK